MRLTPMRYKDYIWPSNPGSYRISFRRVVAEYKLPFGRSVTQDLGQVCRVLEGEGEFAGEGAYEEFKRLATVFYGGGAGVLVHPVWMTTAMATSTIFTAWILSTMFPLRPRIIHPPRFVMKPRKMIPTPAMARTSAGLLV